MLDLKSESGIFFASAVLIVSLSVFLLLGLAGLRIVSAIIVIMLLPFYLIFNNINLNQDEKITFAFFASITLFPSLVYWLGFIVPFRISIIVTFALLLAAAFLILKLKK